MRAQDEYEEKAEAYAEAQVEAYAAARDLDALREATAKYKDVDAAIADGFLPGDISICWNAEDVGRDPDLGAMGIFYVHPERTGLLPTGVLIDGDDTELEWLEPELLTYEPQEDGSLELVGVGYVVFKTAWQARHGLRSRAPRFGDVVFNEEFDLPRTAVREAHNFAPHYHLQVWTERENPHGQFAEFNPNVTCDFFEGTEE